MSVHGNIRIFIPELIMTIMDFLSKVKGNIDGLLNEKPFIHDDFMLTNDYARALYHESAEKMPIIDYHCHLDPKMIAENYQFRDLTEVWLGGDHYKWRALRGNGVPEEFITGNRGSYEKFEKWAETVPYTMRNPLYHWTHLELARAFGIYDTLSPKTARAIYEDCSAKLQTEEYRGQELMKKFNVKEVCTTDDPADSLEYHQALRDFECKILPTFRPDKAVEIGKDQQPQRKSTAQAHAGPQNPRTVDELLCIIMMHRDRNGSLILHLGIFDIRHWPGRDGMRCAPRGQPVQYHPPPPWWKCGFRK